MTNMTEWAERMQRKWNWKFKNKNKIKSNEWLFALRLRFSWFLFYFSKLSCLLYDTMARTNAKNVFAFAQNPLFYFFCISVGRCRRRQQRWQRQRCMYINCDVCATIRSRRFAYAFAVFFFIILIRQLTTMTLSAKAAAAAAAWPTQVCHLLLFVQRETI